MRKRIRDLAVEVSIALAIVCAIVFVASRRTSDSRIAFRWVALAVWTAVAFGYPLIRFRPYWRRSLFWLPCAILLAIHLAAYILLFQRIVVDMASVLIFLITMAEIQVIVAVLKRTARLWSGPKTPDGELRHK